MAGMPAFGRGHLVRQLARLGPHLLAGDDLRPGAGKPLGEAFFRGGTPTYWTGTDATEAPRLQLVSASMDLRHRLGLSSLALVLTFLAWMLGYYPRAMAWIMRFSPEQFILAGCIFWAVFGLNWLAILLFAVGLSARMIYLAGWVFDFWRRPGRALATSGSPVVAGS